MKPIFFIFLLCVLINVTAHAQKAATSSAREAKPAFSVESVIPHGTAIGRTNYSVSFSGQDFKDRNYVFFTDSNATVAYIKVNGIMLRLTGGPNPEHIMTYTGGGYTVTLDVTKKISAGSLADDSDDKSNLKIEGTLAIYNHSGQVVGKKFTGIQTNIVKN
jgi:hypothetical protein